MKIFSFPYVVINELMKHLKPVEQIRLSFCSQNANVFVKTFSNTNPDLCIKRFGNYDGYSIFYPGVYLIHVLSNQPRCFEPIDFKTAHGFKYGFSKHGHFIILCEDAVQCCQEITNYICDLFKTPVANIKITRESDQWLLDFAQRRQEQPLKKVFASLSDMSAQGYSRVMSCNATERLQCRMLSPPHFRLDAKLPSVKTLSIERGFWITKEHLLGLESVNAEFGYTQLTSSDINALLRSWMNRGLPNLKRLEIQGREIDDRNYENLYDRFESIPKELTYECDEFRSAVKFDTNGFHIRRDDRVIATVTLDGHWFVMTVWPDFNGKSV